MRNNSIYSISIALFFLVSLNSCKKKQETDSTPNTTTAPTTAVSKKNGELVVYIKTLNGTSVEKPLKDVKVKLYATDTDRSADAAMVQEKTTDSLGTVHFYQLEKEAYFLKIVHSTKGTLLRNVTTPDKSIAYNTYVYQ